MIYVMKTHVSRSYNRPANAEAILAAAGTTMSVPEAAACLGITESTGYLLVKAGEFPVRTLKLGRQWRVPTAEVRRALGLPVKPATTEAMSA